MPEHMNITYNHPGKCPICGMTLIPKPEEKVGAAASPPSPSPSPSPTEHQH
jgi:heavy metal-binding protein